ncbi:hypothetical protein NDU88_001763 [Pleurodeles waltl]|uniref:Protein Wnt n=1 Tax=Pleurodeles waltl TaxID=8319 RepID=A0AAV7SBR9_PLEWA|nr:hypothetical protein NDU88_001763 [Pleurodeles waltl]
MSVDCRCHGVSGSCAVKTCWKTMSPFEKIGSFLKDKYENSIQISERIKKKVRRKEKEQRKVPIHKGDLVFINRSPNYCVEDRKLGVPGTHGRECNRTSEGPEGCSLLCCGRGYNTHVFDDSKDALGEDDDDANIVKYLKNLMGEGVKEALKKLTSDDAASNQKVDSI